MDLRNEKLVIIEIQQYLLELWQSGMKLPYITPDGIYGNLTRQAIREYQTGCRMRSTGIVNYETWQQLTKDAKIACEERQIADGIFPYAGLLDGGTVRPGEKSDLVKIAQIMLSALSLYDKEDQSITGVYDKETEETLCKFQDLYGLERTNELDKATWNELVSAYNRSMRREG